VQDGVEAELADRLALELRVLDECNVSGLDVLRALAAIGLKLVADEGDEAFVAYEKTQSES
jgi:hypothetical protein